MSLFWQNLRSAVTDVHLVACGPRRRHARDAVLGGERLRGRVHVAAGGVQPEAFTGLVGAILIEQHEEWRAADRRYVSIHVA
jgi:hypothetical protein